jgi:membrane protease YdiL (CAAX protease family)
MHTVTSVVKRYPLATFFILTYIFSWWGYLTGLGQWPAGPLMAALIVVPVTGGKTGLKEWASRIMRWRVGLKWYAIALLLPVALAGAAASLNVLLGAPALTFAHIGPGTDLLIEILIVFLLISLGEEPGWRGYALPRLQEGRSALSATLILAAFGVIWHVPLFLTGDSPWSNIPIIVAGYIFFTWLFNNTRGSVLIAMILHTSNGIIGPLIFGTMFSGADLTRYFWLLTIVYSLVGIVVVILAGPVRLSRRPADQLEGARVAQPLASQ